MSKGQSNFVNYTDFDPAKLTALTPDQKSSDLPNGQKIQYYQMPLVYNYGDDENPVTDELYLQLPKITCPTGIKDWIPKDAKEDEDGKKNTTMWVRFPLGDPNCKLFIEKWNALFDRVVELLFENRQACKINLKPNEINLLKRDLTNPLKTKIDQGTLEPVKGASPTMSFKLSKGGRYRTCFFNKYGKKYEWKDLYNAEITGVPLLHISGVFKGAKVTSLQFKLFSEILTKKPTPLDELNRQLSTMQQLQLEDPDEEEDEMEEKSAAKVVPKKIPPATKSVAESVASAVGNPIVREETEEPDISKEVESDTTTPASSTSSAAPALQSFLEKNRPTSTSFKMPTAKPPAKPVKTIE